MKLLNIFNAAIDAVGGKAAVQNELSQRQFMSPVYLVALGKAASEMTEGAIAALGDNLQQGLVLTKYDHLNAVLQSHPRLVCHESAHPVPDAASLQAGELLCDFVSSVPPNDCLLVLMSGGASSLAEQLPSGMTLENLSDLSAFLLSSGLDITAMNSVRRSLSCIKGGRLVHKVTAGSVLQLAISDVPGDRMQDIGSGPLALSDPATRMPELPAWIRELQEKVPDMPGSDSAFAHIESKIVASSELAKNTAINFAVAQGMTVQPVTGDLHNDVVFNAIQIADVLLADDALPGIYIWAGESTVNLPDDAGRGGRNQHLAALLAEKISGCNLEILCCATDGTDGPTADAGGYVTGETVTRATAAGLNISDSIARADSGNVLEQLGALVTTGPTGTNVMDLVIAEKSAAN